ncbi:MAG: HEAT repeat domain-containing protein [Candidatus Wallbacteria bacterium]|nr:HEAT repeat domain-containing protein [Candidatus Wallbacteria bacterium]
MNGDINRLVQLARASDPAQRLEAVRQLAATEAADALSVLQALGAADPDRTIRIEASRAARELRTRLTGGTMDLAARSGVGPSALAERLRSPEPTERAKALYGCLRYESEKVLNAILDLLDREASAKVRALAVAAIGVLGSSSEVEPMKRFLSDPDVSVRAAADEALTKLGELGVALPGLPMMPPARVPVAPAVAGAAPEPARPAEAVEPAAKEAAAPPLRSTGTFRMPPTATTTGPMRIGAPSRPVTTTGTLARPAALSPFASKAGVAMKAPIKPGAVKPLGENMTPDEKTRLDRLLSSLSGGVLSDVEKSRLADRGTKLYQEVGARLALPALSAEVARALFQLAAGNLLAAAEAFRAAPKETVHLAHLDPYLKAAFAETELAELRAAKEEVALAATGRDAFPADILEMVLGTIRKAKGLMNELDVSARTKLRIRYDTLRELVAQGIVQEAHEHALVLKREMTRLTNVLNDQKDAALKAKRR